MAWTAPRTWVTAEVVTAALMNTHIRDNLLETATAKVTTAGDLVHATAANALARLAVGSSGQYLISDGTNPTWGADGGPLRISADTATGNVRLSNPNMGDPVDEWQFDIETTEEFVWRFRDDSTSTDLPSMGMAPRDFVLHTGNYGQGVGAVIIDTDFATAGNLTTSGSLVLDVTAVITGGPAYVMGWWNLLIAVQTAATPTGTLTVIPRNDGSNLDTNFQVNAHQLSRAGLVAGENWWLSGSFYQRHTATDTSDYELFVVAETNSEWEVLKGSMFVQSIQYPT